MNTLLVILSIVIWGSLIVYTYLEYQRTKYKLELERPPVIVGKYIVFIDNSQQARLGEVESYISNIQLKVFVFSTQTHTTVTWNKSHNNYIEDE